MLTKKASIIVTIGLGLLVDLLLTTVLNLLTGNAWYELLLDYPVVAVIYCIAVYVGTWKYVKKNFMK